MKTPKSKLEYMLLAGALLIGTVAWANDFQMQATSIDPGAMGTVSAQSASGRANTEVTIKTEHLASPTLLTPPATNYVVWIEPQGQAAQQGLGAVNEGILNIGSDEKGELKATTSARDFRVLVTAENSANPQSPSNRVVLQSIVRQ
jgi:hypothetical protein